MATLHFWVERLARWMAMLGGVVLTLLAFIICLSILGRLLNGILHNQIEPFAPELAAFFLNMGIGPINGDFELVEAGVAFAVFAFLPLCQLKRAHASVDIFVSRFPQKLKTILFVAIDFVFAAVLVLIAAQLSAGMQSKMRYGETTFLLQFPVWWAYAVSLLGASYAAFVGLYVAALGVVEHVSGRRILNNTSRQVR